MNHPDHDLLDHYALGQLTDAGQLARVDEHLLVCERCANKWNSQTKSSTP